MCCTRLAENTGRKKWPKIRHLRTIAQNCRVISSQLRHASTIGKKIIKHQYLFHKFSQYGEHAPLTADIGSGVWETPTNFNGVRVLTSVNGDQPNIARYLAVSWAATLYIHSEGLLPLTEFCRVQNSLCVQALRYLILAALLHGTRAVDVSQTLWHGIFTRQGGHPVRHWAVEPSSIFVFFSLNGSVWWSKPVSFLSVAVYRLYSLRMQNERAEKL